MEIEILSAGLIMVACISAGISCIYISRSRSVINKHSRQRIKDFQNDIDYLAQSKKDSDKQHREDIRSYNRPLTGLNEEKQ